MNHWQPKLLAVLPKRFAKYGLTVHPTKTVLVDFQCVRGKTGVRPATVDFLGFTLYWGRSKKNHWVVKYKTAKDRLRRSLSKIEAWCKANSHLPQRLQHQRLSLMLRGHYNYYGIIGNSRCLAQVKMMTERIWRKWLSSRSRKSQIYWQQFRSYLKRHPLPKPRIRTNFNYSKQSPNLKSRMP
ncbi:MAG: hypothetical protein ABIQ95_00500 [Bdellovibrionia bacterium]